MQSSTRRVTFPAANDGPTLRGVLHLPEGGSGPFPGAIVCHPHTLMGGNMGNGVVVSICLALAVAGWAALRFDFRGAGSSQGAFDDGVGERDDVEGAVDFLYVQTEIDPGELVVMGYSFGAGVALHHAARDRRLNRLVGVALVQDHYEDPFLDHVSRPKLLVAGDNDPWTPLDALRTYVERLPPPKELHVVSGADHSFSGHLSEVTNAIVGWLSP